MVPSQTIDDTSLETLNYFSADDDPELSFYDPRGFSNRRRDSSISQTSVNSQKTNASSRKSFPLRSPRSSIQETSRPPTPSQTLVQSMSERVRLALALEESNPSLNQHIGTVSSPIAMSSSPQKPIKPMIKPINTSFSPPGSPAKTTSLSAANYPTFSAADSLSDDDNSLSKLTSDESPSLLSIARSPAVEFLSSFVDRSPIQAVVSPGDEGTRVAGYIIGRTLGQGAFSVVKEAIHEETGEKAAVKIIQHTQTKLHRTNTLVDLDDTHDISAGLRRASMAGSPGTESTRENNGARVAAYLEREIYICSLLEPHPHIVPIVKLFSTHLSTFIFMPLCTKGNLLQYINDVLHPIRGRTRGIGERTDRPRKIQTSAGGGSRESELRRKVFVDFRTVQSVIHQIALGLYYLHNRAKVTHNDLKLENVLLGDDGYFRIADFGLATINDKSSAKKSGLNTPLSISRSGSPDTGFLRSPPIPLDGSAPFSAPDSGTMRGGFGNPDRSAIPSTGSGLTAGSVQYCPPEQVQAMVQSVEPSVDIWAFGCILYALLTGTLPFDDDYEPRLRVKISRGEWNVPTILTGSIMDSPTSTNNEEREQILELLRGCLEKRVKRRWKIGRILRCKWLAELTTTSELVSWAKDDHDENEEEDDDEELGIEQFTESHDKIIEEDVDERMGRKRILERSTKQDPHERPAFHRSISRGRVDDDNGSPTPGLYMAHMRGRRQWRGEGDDKGSRSRSRRREKSGSASRERRRNNSRTRLDLTSVTPATPVLTPVSTPSTEARLKQGFGKI